MTQPPVTGRPPIESALGGLEPHGERRRRQLIRAAAHVIEYEGLDALRMPRVAELAGCARTLVYRYFPTRDDLLKGVVTEYYTTLEAELDRRSRDSPLGADLPDAGQFGVTVLMFDVSFDVITELGLAGLLLRSSPHLGEVVREHISKESANFSSRWIEPLRLAGLSDVHAGIVSQACVAALVEIVHRWQRDELTRDEAVDLTRTVCLSLLRGLARAYAR